MKYGRILLPVVGLAVFMAGDAFAACPGTAVTTQSDIVALLGNKRIIAGGGEIPGDNEWHEDHCLGGEVGANAGGNLYKVGLGPGDPVDPRKQVGTWEANNNGTLTYDYGSPAATYTWKLYRFGSPAGGFSLCWQKDSDPGVTVIGHIDSEPVGSCP